MFNIVIGLCLCVNISFYSKSEEAILGKWELIEIIENGQIVEISDPIKVDFSVEGKLGKFTGNTKKNFFSGLFDLKSKKQIQIQGLMATKMPDTDVSKKFLKYFGKISSYSFDNEALILSNDDLSQNLKLRKFEN